MNNTGEIILHEGKTEQKTRFVELRAKGYPYSKICKELEVSKGTLTVWNGELSEEIAKLKAENLRTLYDTYFMNKEARIKRLGDMLKKIEDELSKKDLSSVPAEKLLDYQLRYVEALRDEYIEPQDTETVTELNAEGILKEVVSLFAKIKSGEITKEQAYRENIVIANLLKAYENSILEKKIDALKSILHSR